MKIFKERLNEQLKRNINLKQENQQKWHENCYKNSKKKYEAA